MHERHIPQARGQRLEQVERARVGPVDVLEDEQCRLPAREPLDQAARRVEQVLSPGRARLGLQPDQAADVLRHLGGVAIADQRGRRVLQLRPGLRGQVAVEDVGDLLDVLRERAVGRRLAVGHRAAANRLPARFVHALGELGGEPALADPRRAEHRDDVRPLLGDGLIPDPSQQPELVAAAHERVPLPTALSRRSRSGQGEPGGHRSALPLHADGLDGLVLDDRARRPVRLLADEHAVHGSEALEPGRGVDHVARDQSLPLRHVGVQRDDRLAGVDGDAHLQVDVRRGRAQLRHAVPDRQRRAHGPLRVVPVSDGRAEDPHHRVADELLDGSAAGLDLGSDALEVRRLDRPNVFGIEPFRTGGEADEIREEDRDDLPLLARASLVRARRVPQALQNFASGGFSRPQLGQTFTP